MADGRIVIDTDLDNSGVDKGLKSLNSLAEKSANNIKNDFKDTSQSLAQSINSGAEKAKQSTMAISGGFKTASMSAAKDFKDSSMEIKDESSKMSVSLIGRFKNWTEESKKKLNDLSEEAKETFSNIANTSKTVVLGGIAALGTAIAGASISVIKLGDDYQKASNTLQTQTGATAKEMDNLNEAMTNVYGNNFGESMQDVAESMAQVRTYLQGTGEDIESATQNAISFRDTFGVEVPESMRSVTTLMNQFGITSEEAFNLLAQGQQQNLNFSGELYDSVNEYSVQFKKLGLDAEDMFNIFNDGAIDGAFNLDKIGDAVKEFSIRAIDGSKTTQEGFQALGLNADEMAKKFAVGGDTAKDAFIQVTQAIAHMHDPVQQSIVGVNLFGTMWEDLGPAVVTQMGNIGDSFNKTIDTMNEINKIKYNSFGEALTGLGRQIQTQLLLPIAKDVLPSLNEMANQFKATFASEDVKSSIKSLSDGLSNFIKNIASSTQDILPKLLDALAWLLNNANNIAAGIIGIGVAMKVFEAASLVMSLVKAFQAAKKVTEGLTIAQWLYNTALNANPIGIIVALIAGLIAAVVYLWNTNEGFRNAVIGAWNAIKQAASAVWGAIVSFFTETIPNAFKGMMDFFGQAPAFFGGIWTSITTAVGEGIQAVISWFAGLPGTIWGFLVGIVTNIATWGASVYTTLTTWIGNGITAVINFFVNLPYNLGYALGFALGTIVKWGVDAWNYLSTNVPIWIDSVVNFFATLPGRIWTWLVNVVNNIINWGTNVYNTATTWISNTINNIITWFSQLPGRVWTWLVNTISNIAKWGSNAYSTATTWVSNTINGIINWFSQLPGRIWSWLSNTINNIVRWGSDMVSRGRQSASDLVSSVVDAISSLPGKMLDIGKNIVHGIWNGITGAAGWLKDKVGSFVTGIVDGFKSGLGIHSPSRIMRDLIGTNLVKGIGVGIDYEMPNLRNDIDSNIDELTAKLKTTVDYETAKTTAGVVAQNNYSTINNNTVNNNSKLDKMADAIKDLAKRPIQTSVNIDGKKAAEATNEYHDEINGGKVDLSKRGVIY